MAPDRQTPPGEGVSPRFSSDAEKRVEKLQRALQTLSACNAAVVRATDERRLLDDICAIMVKVGGHELASVARGDRDRPIRCVALSSRRPNDSPASRERRWSDPTSPVARALQLHVTVLEAAEESSVLALPISSHGEVYGVLEIRAARPMEEDERDLLEQLTSDLAFGVRALRARRERDRALRSLQSSEQNLRTVLEHDTNGVLVLDRNAIILFANPAATQMLGRPAELLLGRPFAFPLVSGEQAEISLVRPDGSLHTADMRAVETEWFSEPVYVVALHDTTEQRKAQEQLRILARVFEGSHEAILITDRDRRIVAANRAFEEMMGYAEREVIGADPDDFCIGIDHDADAERRWERVEATGHWQGEMGNRRKDGKVIPLWLAISAVTDEQGAVQHYVAIGSDISEQKAAQERIRFLAFHDVLTGLPNRALFNTRLELAIAMAKRTGGRLAVLFVDLDRFKMVNDSLGHTAGDELLRQVGKRLTDCVRGEDTISRQGGDEFLLLVSALKAPYAVVPVARKILKSLSRPYRLQGTQVHVTPSIGIAIYPEDGIDGETLVKNADAAMYYAKEQGRNNFQFFVADLNQRVNERISMENALRRALNRGELELHYQPQIDARSGAVVGIEALLRWRRRGALVPPAEFLTVAEEAGLIIPIGEWVVTEACRQHKLWREQGFPATRIAINLSASEFHQQASFDRLHRMMVEACTDQCLEIELTEGVLMREAEGSLRRLRALKEAGFSLAIDDFGTGYSSLNYLRRFPIDRLKVDRSFVHDLETNAVDRAITEAIIALARSLDLTVVAEGVETQAEARVLTDQRCQELQGFFFTPPLPPAQFAEWWKRRMEQVAAGWQL